MTDVLRELTAGATCWPTDTLRHAVQALKEIATLHARDATRLVCWDGPTDADLATFNEWLAAHADSSKVDVQRVGDQGNGLVANTNLLEGESFISVPYDVILGADPSLGPATEDTKAWSQIAQDPLLARFPSCLLALRVLNEACKCDAKTKKSSFFRPYIATLPAQFDIPLFYEVSDFEAIHGTSLFEPAVKLLYNSIKQFFYLQRLCRQGWPQCPIPTDKFTLSNYFWAMGVVLTRQNEVAVGDGGRAAMALIPGWDMCNHEAGERITSFSDPVKRVIECHAKRAFAAKEQVTMFYGPRTNEQLLLYSGFVTNENPWDRASVRLRMDTSSDPLVKIRRMVIQKEAAADRSVVLWDEDVYVQVGADGSLASYATLRVLQILSFTKDSLTKALRSSSSVGTQQLYEWTDEERQLAKEKFGQACETTVSHLQSLASKVLSAPHGNLFQRYFDAQCSAVISAKQNSVVFEA